MVFNFSQFSILELKATVISCSHSVFFETFLIMWKVKFFLFSFCSKRVPITPPGGTPSQDSLTDEQVNLYKYSHAHV